MTFLDVLHFNSASQGALSADGKRFAYVLTSLDWKAGRRYSEIHLTEVETGQRRQLTYTADKDESSPAFSHDGQWLAFLSNRDGANQVYLLSVAGGEAKKISAITGGATWFGFSRDNRWVAVLGGRGENRQLALYDLREGKSVEVPRHKTGLTSAAWAPDSSRLYFSAVDQAEPEEQRRMDSRFDVRIVDSPRPPRQMWEYRLQDKQFKQLTKGAEHSVSSFNVSRDGRYISFTGGSSNRYADSRQSEAFLLHLETEKLERLTQNQVGESVPQVSPDGRWVAFTGPQEFTFFRRSRLFVRPVQGGDWKVLPVKWDGDVRSISWSNDSRKIYFTDGLGVSEELYELEVNGQEPAQVTKLNGVVSASYSQDAGRLVIQFEDPTQPRDFYLAAPADAGNRARWRRLTDVNPQVKDLALGEYETVRWKSSDGATVEGLLVKPVGYEAGKRYPLIVQLHGGPAAAYVRNFSASYGTYTHVFAGGGYAVFQPNYRGSSNYGERFRMEIAGDYFRQAYDDIITGVDELIRRGVADADKLGMMGWSAGGHWSNWTLTRTDRFKAISSGAGAVNWISLYAQTDVQSNREFYFKGLPYENWDHYIEVSPLRYIRNAKTPTLIHVGHDDQRVPRPQSEELHMALKKLGVPTEFIVYPRMGHGITEPRFQLVKMVSEYNWFEKWIRGKEKWFDWKELLDTLPRDEKETKE